MSRKQTGSYEKVKPTKEQMETAYDDFPVLYQFIKKITRNDHDAEDITSNQYLKLLEVGYYPYKGDPKEDIRIQLFDWAKNECIDYFRRRKSRNTHSSDMSGEELFVEEETLISLEMEKYQLLARLNELKEELPSDVKDMIEKNIIEGKSMKEIAAELKIGFWGTYKRKDSVFEKFRKQLKPFRMFA